MSHYENSGFFICFIRGSFVYLFMNKKIENKAQELYTKCFERYCTELSHDKNVQKAKAIAIFIAGELKNYMPSIEEGYGVNYTECNEILNDNPLDFSEGWQEVKKIISKI